MSKYSLSLLTIFSILLVSCTQREEITPTVDNTGAINTKQKTEYEIKMNNEKHLQAGYNELRKDEAFLILENEYNIRMGS